MDDLNENQIYLKTVKLMVNNFNEFLNEVYNYDKPLSDNDLLNKLKNINEILEKILKKRNSENDICSKDTCDVNERISKKLTNDQLRNECFNEKLTSDQYKNGNLLDFIFQKSTFDHDCSEVKLNEIIYKPREKTEMNINPDDMIENTEKKITEMNVNADDMIENTLKKRTEMNVNPDDMIKNTMKKRTKMNVNLDDMNELYLKIGRSIKSSVDDVKYEDNEIEDENVTSNYSDRSSQIDNLQKTILLLDLSISPNKLYNAHEVYIVQFSDNMWRCHLCKTEFHSNNLKSHVNGKQHKIGIEGTASSLDSKDLNLVLKDVDSNLIKNENGLDYISTGFCYTCTLCSANFNCKDNLKQHILGMKHRKLCQKS